MNFFCLFNVGFHRIFLYQNRFIIIECARKEERRKESLSFFSRDVEELLFYLQIIGKNNLHNLKDIIQKLKMQKSNLLSFPYIRSK